MKKGDLVDTPRFCKVKIEKVFSSRRIAAKYGYTESTDYKNWKYEVRGKSIGNNMMIFAGIKKG